MIRANFGVLQESRRIKPNGLYEAYRETFDEIFTLPIFRESEFKRLYIFDRFEPELPRSLPLNWRKVELIGESIITAEFSDISELGPYEKDMISFLLINSIRKSMWIVGRPGVGKSTFIDFMFRHYLPKQQFFAHGFIQIIDLSKILRVKDHYTYEESVTEVLAEIRRISRDAGEAELCDAAWSHRDYVDFIRKKVKASAPNRVVVVFDGGDLFSGSFQTSVGEFSQSLAQATDCTVVVALRVVNTEHFSDFALGNSTVNRVMYQQPPRIKKVVERRLVHLMEERAELFVPRQVQIDHEQFSLTPTDVQSFLSSFTRMLFSSKVQEAFEQLTNYEVSLALIWALDFLRSYNLNVSAMVSRFMKSTNIDDLRPIDEFDSFLFAIGLCNHQIYFPSCSRLENLFSAGLSNDHDLLIKYRCLKFCSSFDPVAHKDALRDHLSMFGYASAEITKAANALLSAPRCLLESMEGRNLETIKSIHVTYAGSFYLNKLLYYITYLQIVSDDIILPDGIVLNKGSWSERIENLIRFLSGMCDREIEEADRFFSAAENSVQQIRDYGDIYGTTPLAARLLGSLRGLIAGRVSRILAPNEKQEAVVFQQKVEFLQHELSQRLRTIMRLGGKH